MSVAPGEVIEAAVIHDNTTSGEQINVMQFQLDGPGPLADATVLDDISFIIEALYGAYQAFINVRNVFREITVRNKTTLALIGSVDAGVYVGGTDANPAEPQGVAPYVFFKTAVPRVVPKKFLPSISQVRVDGDGLPHASLQIAVGIFGSGLLAPWVFGASTYQYGHLSAKTLGFEIPTIAVTPDAFGYQRRRKPGSGS